MIVAKYQSISAVLVGSSDAVHFRPDTCRFGLDQYPEIDVAKNGTKTGARGELESSKSLKKRVFWIKILEGICYLLNVTFQRLQKKPLCLGYLLNVTFQRLQKSQFASKRASYLLNVTFWWLQKIHFAAKLDIARLPTSKKE